MSSHDRDLGMKNRITRRDFLNGMGVGLSSSLLYPSWLQGADPAEMKRALQEGEDYRVPVLG